MEKRIYLSSPHMCGQEMKYINEAFETNWVAPLGKNVDEFEKEISNVTEKKYGAALTCGTAALHLALKWLDVKLGDYVFCSSLTFSGSCNPILYEKAIPVFIDSESKTLNMCPQALAKAFEWAVENNCMPKAVIIVNLYGVSADYDKLLPICKKYGVPVIEDAAESLGGNYRGKASGSLGDLSIVSFNGNKIITTSGGGMLLCDDDAAIKKARFWATQARDKAPYYLHSEIGYNYRMSNICAGIGRGQVTVIAERVAKKKLIYERYCTGFLDSKSVKMFDVPTEQGESNYWLSILMIDKNSGYCPMDIVNSLEQNNIEARPIWKPMHTQPIFEKYPFFKIFDKAIGEDVFEYGLCLPSDTKMTKDEQDCVIENIKRTVGDK